MSPEEQILKETEQIVNGYAEDMSKRQTIEHQRMMPYFRRYADNVLSHHGKDANGVYLFVITEADEQDPMADNPLELNDGTTGQMSPMFTFNDIDEAVEHMSSMPAAVLFNELRKSHEGKVAVYIRAGKVSALYGQYKLTLDKQLLNGDHLVETASLSGDDPKEFFDKMGIDAKHKMLSGALLSMCELGKIAETRTPETYKVMVKRIGGMMEEDDE